MEVKVLSYDYMSKWNKKEKIKKIIEIILKKNIVLFEGRLTPDEEQLLTIESLKKINKNFKGIEIAFLEDRRKKKFFEKIKTLIVKSIMKNRIGLTVIGPSKIVKEIKMDPEKLDILLK